MVKSYTITSTKMLTSIFKCNCRRLSSKAEPAPATSNIPPVNHRVYLAMALTAKSFVYDVLTNPQHTRWIAPLLILGDALLCALVIWKIACKTASRCRVINQIQLTKQQPQTLRLTGRRICSKSLYISPANATTS